ncbi:MAG: tRNA (adenosine(37)-N6)-threonylcarbamoyltransferase complex dimerization subunit type 1 TsaB [Cypionkella sp.]
MRMLAIETATEACSVALFEDGLEIDSRHAILGRGHAEHLVPMIAELPDKGRAQQIRVSLGPGSFTGVRIGLAVAGALGVAWRSEVLGYPTLSLVAQMNDLTGALLPGSLDVADPPDFLVCMEGGHGEWFVQPFTAALHPAGPILSLPPREAAARFDEAIIVGSRAEEFAALRGSGQTRTLLPDARYAGALNLHHLTSKLTPIYGRAPDARPPA